MGRNSNKIDSIAVDTVSQEVNRHELLHPDFNKGDKQPFFDGHIFVYKKPKQTNDNYSDRIPVQIKGREISSFSRNKCRFRPVKKAELEAYRKDSGIIFFVVEVLKNKDDKKIFWKFLLPYDISKLLSSMEAKKTGSTAIVLADLAKHDLTLLCQNFIENREKQKQVKAKTFCEIKGLDGFVISAITGLFGRGDKALNDYILAEYPLYCYAVDQNDTSFPIGNFIDDGIYLQFQATEEVRVGDKSYGNRYFSWHMSKKGYYPQFGKSWRFLLDGQAKFSATGTLEERITDLDFLLEVIKGGEIRIGGSKFPYTPHLLPEQNISVREMEQKLKSFQVMKRAFEFLGINSSVDITALGDRDFRRIFALSEHVIHGKECPITFKNEGVNVLGIGKYRFVVLAYQKKIINLFSPDYPESVWAGIKMSDGTQVSISPYFFLNAEIIAKGSNFDGEVVMESIKAFPYSPAMGGEYNNLLLEAIKAIDIVPESRQVVKFSNDLADFLLENEENLTHRLNKMQIQKRFGLLGKQDAEWLLVERDRQNDPKLLCGIAILLDDTTLFDEQFAKLTRKQQTEFRKYPIMKLLEKNTIQLETKDKKKRGRLPSKKVSA